MTRDWSRFKPDAEVFARASGRRRYNSERQTAALVRRWRVLQLLYEYAPDGLARGTLSRIASELGVHRSTISRDYRSLVYANSHECPTCRREMANEQWATLAEKKGTWFGIDPLSPQGQARIWALDAIRQALPGVLADWGLFIDDDDLVSHSECKRSDGRPSLALETLVEQVADRALFDSDGTIANAARDARASA